MSYPPNNMATSGTDFIELLRLPDTSAALTLPPIKSPKGPASPYHQDASQPSHHTNKQW